LTEQHRHFSIDEPPLFCEACGKAWNLVEDGRSGRRRRRAGYGPRQRREVRFNRMYAEVAGLPVAHGALRTCAQRLAEYLDHRVGCPGRDIGQSADCTCGLIALLDQPVATDQEDVVVDRPAVLAVLEKYR
jgi:hypothetical protein